MTTAAVARKNASLDTIQEQIERIRAGVRFRELEKLQKALGVSLEELARALGMSRATLHRRKNQGRLAAAESERLLRYQRLLERASDVFGGSDKAREWLGHRQAALGNAVPLQFAAT